MLPPMKLQKLILKISQYITYINLFSITYSSSNILFVLFSILEYNMLMLCILPIENSKLLSGIPLSSVYTLLTNLRVRSLIYILNKSKESINQLTNNDIHSNVPYSGTIVRRVPLLGICPELRNTMANTYQSKSVIIIKN